MQDSILKLQTLEKKRKDRIQSITASTSAKKSLIQKSSADFGGIESISGCSSVQAFANKKEKNKRYTEGPENSDFFERMQQFHERKLCRLNSVRTEQEIKTGIVRETRKMTPKDLKQFLKR
jgi:hypothetical protein